MLEVKEWATKKEKSKQKPTTQEIHPVAWGKLAVSHNDSDLCTMWI